MGITPGWGGTTRMARLIGRRMTKEINLIGALHPASRAVELGLWNRVVEHDAAGRRGRTRWSGATGQEPTGDAPT